MDGNDRKGPEPWQGSDRRRQLSGLHKGYTTEAGDAGWLRVGVGILVERLGKEKRGLRFVEQRFWSERVGMRVRWLSWERKVWVS